MGEPATAAPHFHWWLPTTDDGHHIVSTNGVVRAPTLGYLSDVARAAERNGIESLLIPVGGRAEEPWITAAAVGAATSKVELLIAVRPGQIAPTYAAHMAATLQRFTGNRLQLNVVTGGDEREQRAHGDALPKDLRYARTAEFIEVLRKSWTGDEFDYAGSYYTVHRAGGPNCAVDVAPRIFFGGASPQAQQVAARHADVQLLFGEPVGQAAGRVRELQSRAGAAGRQLEFGIRLHVIARRTAAHAWAEANYLLDQIPDELIANRQQAIRASSAEGQRRISALNVGTKADRAALQIAPNLWAGTGLVMGGAGTALVGSYEEVAERLREYVAVGVTHFILSGYPKLESLYEVAEQVLPLARSRAS
jgi:alkanesulfonate monooxygenase